MFNIGLHGRAGGMVGPSESARRVSTRLFYLSVATSPSWSHRHAQDPVFRQTFCRHRPWPFGPSSINHITEPKAAMMGLIAGFQLISPLAREEAPFQGCCQACCQAGQEKKKERFSHRSLRLFLLITWHPSSMKDGGGCAEHVDRGLTPLPCRALPPV